MGAPIRAVYMTALEAEDHFRQCPSGLTVPEALNMFDIDEEKPARRLILVERGEKGLLHALVTHEDLPLLMAPSAAS